MEAISPSVGEGNGFTNVLWVGDGGEGGGLGGGGGIEGLAGFLENGGNGGVSESVADAEAGEALDFGEGTEKDKGATFLDPLDGGGRFGDKFVVGFVEDEEWPVGELLDKGGEFGVGDTGTSGIIGGGEKDEADVCLQAGGEAGEVVMEIAIGDFFEGDMEETSHEAIDGEGVGGSENAALAWLGVGVVAEFDNFVGAATEDDVVGGESVGFGDGLAEVESAAVGVEVGMVEAITNGLEGAGGWAEGVFVGGEFDDLGRGEPVFASDIGDRPTWLVGLEISDVRIGGGGHEESWVWGLGVEGNGEGLSGAEAVEGAADFGVAWGEASGGEEGGVGGARGAGGEEGAWGGGSELAEEGEGFFRGGGLRDEEGGDGCGGRSYILGNVGG